MGLGSRRGGQVKLRVCECCGDSKPTQSFTHNPRKGEYTPTCKDCGVWLFLFRRVFPKTRDFEANRIKQREREHSNRKAKRLEASQHKINEWRRLMAIRMDSALMMMPNRTQDRLNDELKFGGFPNGRGPISEAVMPLNQELIHRADIIDQQRRSIRLLEAEVKKLKEDEERLNYIQRNPKMGEMFVNGKAQDCYFYAVAGHPGLKLREIIDSCIKSEEEKSHE